MTKGIIVAGLSGGSGKSVVSVGLTAALANQGKVVVRSPLIALAWFGLAMESGYPKAEVEFLRIKGEGGGNDLSALKRLQDKLMEMSLTSCN